MPGRPDRERAHGDPRPHHRGVAGLLPALAPALDAVSAALPAPLVSEDALHALRRLSRALPGVTRSFGFECRLDDRDDRVDLGMAITGEDGGRDVLAGRADDPLLARAVAHDERWQRLSRLAARWSEQSSPLHAWVAFLGFEFDAVSAAEAIPVPSVFVALDAPLSDESDARPSLAAAREAAALLRGNLSPALEARVVEAFERLPAGGFVLHLAAMLGRHQEGLRLSVALPGETLEPYLGSLGGDAAADAAGRALRALPHRLARAQVDFDLLPAVAPRIGLGLRPGESRREAWASLLRELVALGWADEAKADALLEWPGASPAKPAVSGGWIALRREISHVKLVCTPAAPFQTKAYFGATLVRSIFG